MLGPDGRGRPPVALSGNFDPRAAGSPDYYKHTDASLAFQRVGGVEKLKRFICAVCSYQLVKHRICMNRT